MLTMVTLALLRGMRPTDTGCGQLVAITPHHRENKPMNVAAHGRRQGQEAGVGTDKHGRPQCQGLGCGGLEVRQILESSFRQ